MEKRSIGMLIIGILVALGAIGIAIISTNYSNSEKTSEKNSIIAAKPVSYGSSSAIDSDGDGVPDWKEVLWRTDPQNPDTDGDGIGDAEELESKLNPSLTETFIEKVEYTAPKALTPTEAVSRELFASYANFKQDGSFNTTDAQLTVSETLARNIDPVKSAPTYTLSSIVINPNASLNEYELSILNAFKRMADIREYELTTFTRAVETEDFSELTKLVAAGAIYNEVVGLILIIEAPDTLASKHLAVVNALSGLAFATGGLSTWNGDPLVGLELVNAFASAEQKFSNAVTNLYTLINTLK